MTVGRIYIVGDIGGHFGVLQAVLDELGVDAAGHLPQDATVIQVGDLIRTSPQFVHSNTKIVRKTQELIEANPDSWIQLCGNHECAGLGGPARLKWDVESAVERECREILLHLWQTKEMVLASAVNGSIFNSESNEIVDAGPMLVTHAGYTRGSWVHDGESTSPFVAASIINRDCGRPMAEISRPGSLVTGQTTIRTDTMWPEVNRELLEPWLSHGDPPFPQIHGHASPYHWPAEQWWDDTPNLVRQNTTLDFGARRSVTGTVLVDGQVSLSDPFFMSVDWTLENEAPSQIWPLLCLNSTAGVS